MKDILFLSASNLIKQSLAQMVYYHFTKKEKKVTSNQLKGNVYAEKVSKGLAQELRGAYKTDKYIIFFCIDAIDNNKAIEIKMVDNINTFEIWYLQKAIIQSVFYFTLLKNVDVLTTPKFRINEGYEKQILDIVKFKITKFELWFGENKYLINRSNKVLNHYIDKCETFIKIIENNNFTDSLILAKEYDNKYKFQEWQILKKDIKYKLIK